MVIVMVHSHTLKLKVKMMWRINLLLEWHFWWILIATIRSWLQHTHAHTLLNSTLETWHPVTTAHTCTHCSTQPSKHGILSLQHTHAHIHCSTQLSKHGILLLQHTHAHTLLNSTLETWHPVTTAHTYTHTLLNSTVETWHPVTTAQGRGWWWQYSRARHFFRVFVTKNEKLNDYI